MTCKKCKSQIPANSAFCNFCGAKQQNNQKRHRTPRSCGQGTITKLGGRRAKPYWARGPADYSSGVPVRQSLGCFKTYADAAAAIGLQLYTQKEEQRSIVTIQELYDRFVESHYFEALSKSAQGSHRSAWRHLKAVAEVDTDTVTKDTFQIPVDQMAAQGLRRETLAKVRNLASLLCKEAMGLGLIAVNFGQLVQLPKDDKVGTKPFSSEDLLKIWDAADAGDTDAMAVLILVYTGMRPTELLNLMIDIHLHTDGEFWYAITGSKTEAGFARVIPIPRLIHPCITQLISDRRTGPVVVNSKGTAYRLDNWRPRRFNVLMERLGLEGYTPYSARHTFADMQKRRNLDPEIVMNIMGHTDYATTVENYHTTTSEDINRICQSVDDLSRPTQNGGLILRNVASSACGN